MVLPFGKPDMATNPKPGNLVRLLEAAAGMPLGSEGVLLGWYARDVREALVNFWDGGPQRVPADAIAEVQEGQAACG